MAGGVDHYDVDQYDKRYQTGRPSPGVRVVYTCTAELTPQHLVEKWTQST